MRPFLLATLLFASCSSTPPAATIATRQTTLEEGSCRKATTPNDPNDTPYLVCPGVAGFTLNVRQVESGRTSIDVVDPTGKVHPLEFQNVITSSMFGLDPKAEWRVTTRNGEAQPIALIVKVQAHEEPADPAKVTNTYIAIAKVTPQQICVTDKLSKQAQPDEVLRIADAAGERPCAAPLPATQTK